MYILRLLIIQLKDTYAVIIYIAGGGLSSTFFIFRLTYVRTLRTISLVQSY